MDPSSREPAIETVIDPAGGGSTLGEVWRARELLLFLARRDLIVRYRQTAIGLGWVVVRPVLQTVVLTVVFGRIAGLQAGPVPYAVLVLAGLIPWQCFANIVTECSISVVNNAPLVTKVYFPRLVLPLATVPVNLIDAAVSLALALALMLWHGIVPGWTWVLLPFATIPLLIPALGIGLLASALNVRYRDLKNLIPFLLQLTLIASPVAFAARAIPDGLRIVGALNPLLAPVECWRWCMLGTGYPIEAQAVALSTASGVVLLVLARGVFRRMERDFADVI